MNVETEARQYEMHMAYNNTSPHESPILRYGDLLACKFFYLSHRATPFPIVPLDVCDNVNHEKTRVMGLPTTERLRDRTMSHPSDHMHE